MDITKDTPLEQLLIDTAAHPRFDPAQVRDKVPPLTSDQRLGGEGVILYSCDGCKERFRLRLTRDAQPASAFVARRHRRRRRRRKDALPLPARRVRKAKWTNQRWAALWRCRQCPMRIWNVRPNDVDAILAKHRKVFLPRLPVSATDEDSSSVDSSGDAGTASDGDGGGPAALTPPPGPASASAEARVVASVQDADAASAEEPDGPAGAADEPKGFERLHGIVTWKAKYDTDEGFTTDAAALHELKTFLENTGGLYHDQDTLGCSIDDVLRLLFRPPSPAPAADDKQASNPALSAALGTPEDVQAPETERARGRARGRRALRALLQDVASGRGVGARPSHREAEAAGSDTEEDIEDEEEPLPPGADNQGHRDPALHGDPGRRYDRNPNLSPASPADEQDDDDPESAREQTAAQAKDDALAAAGASGEEEGADGSDAGNQDIDFGRVAPPTFRTGIWFKVENYRGSFRCKAYNKPAPHGTTVYRRYRRGEVFGPVLAHRHAQVYRDDVPFAFVAAQISLGGRDAWISVWCNRNEAG